MKLKTIDLTGSKSTQIDLPDELFAGTINPKIIATYLRVFQARQRSDSASAKTRGQVTATTAKVWRQKGTGRARHGSRRAPIFVGGGKSHGPTTVPSRTLTLSKKTKHIALVSALSSQAKNIQVVTGFDQLDPKTKLISTTLSQKLGTKNSQRLLLVLHSSTLPQIKATQNLPFITTTQAHRLNTHEVLHANTIVFTPESLDILTKLHLKSTQASTSKSTTETKKPATKSTSTKTKTTTKNSKTKPTTKTKSKK